MPAILREGTMPMQPKKRCGYASMSWPSKNLEAIVLSERLRHGGNPVLRWMASNVSLETDAADNWKPSKTKSRERIDGIAAVIMGLERATTDVPFTGHIFYLMNDVEMG